MTFDIDAPADTRTAFQREAAEAFARGIATLTDMAENHSDGERIIAKRDALAAVWERQGDRIQNVTSLNDLAAIISFITLEGEDRVDVAEGALQGETLAIRYLRGLVSFLD